MMYVETLLQVQAGGEKTAYHHERSDKASYHGINVQESIGGG
jgi:hypothetical protein